MTFNRLRIRRLNSPSVTNLVLRTILALTIVALASIGISSLVAQQQTSTSSGAKHYLKIGKGIQPPQPLQTPQVQEPRAACKVTHEFTVLLWIGVNEEGVVEAARVTRSAAADLDRKALEQVKQWKFTPALRNGQVPVQTNAEFHFSLC